MYIYIYIHTAARTSGCRIITCIIVIIIIISIIIINSIITNHIIIILGEDLRMPEHLHVQSLDTKRSLASADTLYNLTYGIS